MLTKILFTGANTMTKTHLIIVMAFLLFSVQVKADDSSPNASNLATLFDVNVTSCSVQKTRTHTGFCCERTRRTRK
jgi:hypothetical protein